MESDPVENQNQENNFYSIINAAGLWSNIATILGIIILFVVFRSSKNLNKTLIESIKKQIRNNCSPRHVPAKIIKVGDIPREHAPTTPS